MNNLVKWRFFFVIIVLIAGLIYTLGAYAIHSVKGNPVRIGGSWITSERGKILDRYGKVLASDTTRYNVYITPGRLDRDQRSTLTLELAPILGMSAETINANINDANGRFLLKRQIPESAMEMIREQQSYGGLRGVSTEAVTVRVYPEKNLAAQIIGFTGRSNNGLEGVEYAFDEELSEGKNVILTIDANVQYILEKVAQTTKNETQAESVMFLAMDPRNGELLGSAIVPGFDPNNYQSWSNEYYRNLSANIQYEPGSVFKAFSIAALLDSGVISEDSEFYCSGVYERVFPGETVKIECADGTAHGRVRAREIIIHSCNVGAALAADRYENRAFHQSLLNYGFGRRTGAWVNAETAGLLKTPNLWSGRSRQSIAFGQEIAVSALQVMQAASAIANDGILVPPKMISRVVSADGKNSVNWTNNNNTNRRVIAPETARRMLSYMSDTATNIGTGWRANIDDLRLAVKTGTSQYRDQTGEGYSTTDFIASCVALLPAESPSLVLYVVISKPRGETYGGRIAAPAIRDAAEQLINYLGIPRGRNPIVEHPGSISIVEEKLPVIGSTVPNFIGLSKKTLVPLLDRNDVHVEIFGDGWVRRQTPQPGTELRSGMVIELILE